METVVLNKYLNDLVIFSQVMRHKSFSRAAEEVGVSKSHVSKAMVRLEQNLGVQLFERSSRRMTPSLIAEDMFNQIEGNLYNIDRTLNDIRSTQSVVKGRLRITTAGEYGENVITQKTIAFAKEYPDVEFDITFSNQILDLAENHIDIAIRTGILPDSNLIARPIDFRRLTIVCSHEYAEQYGTPKTPDDLKHHRCLVGSSNQWIFQHNEHPEYMKVWGKWQSNNGNSVLLAALHGLGIAQLPEAYTQTHLQEGTLVECLAEYQPTKSPVWAVFQKNSVNSITVRKFVDSLISI